MSSDTQAPHTTHLSPRLMFPSTGKSMQTLLDCGDFVGIWGTYNSMMINFSPMWKSMQTLLNCGDFIGI